MNNDAQCVVCREPCKVMQGDQFAPGLVAVVLYECTNCGEYRSDRDVGTLWLDEQPDARKRVAERLRSADPEAIKVVWWLNREDFEKYAAWLQAKTGKPVVLIPAL